MLTMKEELAKANDRIAELEEELDYEVDSGTVTITPTSANTVTSAEITFNTTFSNIPSMSVMVNTKYPNTRMASANVGGTTGATIYLYSDTTTGLAVRWIAIAKK